MSHPEQADGTRTVHLPPRFCYPLNKAWVPNHAAVFAPTRWTNFYFPGAWTLKESAKSAPSRSMWCPEALQARDRPPEVPEAQIKQLDSNISSITQELQNCVSVLASQGAAALTEELNAAANELRARKQRLLVERERAVQRLTVSQQNAVDEKDILSALRQFAELFPRLEPADQKRLMALLIERVEARVSKQAPSPGGSRALEFTFKLHIPRLGAGVDHQALLTQRHASPGPRLTLNMKTAVGQEGRAASVRILEPFIYPPEKIAPKEHVGARHSIHTALKWQETLRGEPTLSQREFAKCQGVSPPLVTYHLKLLSLVPEIRSFLLELREAHPVYFFSLRRMRAFAELGEGEQRKIFAEWCADYMRCYSGFQLPSVKHFPPKNAPKSAFTRKRATGAFRVRT